MNILDTVSNLEVIYNKKNLREASEELHIDQSTLNKRIKKLEAHYGIPLIVRNNHEVKLTEEGYEVLNSYEKIKEILKELEDDLAERVEIEIGTTGEIFLSSSLVESNYKNVRITNSIEKLINKFNNKEISCVILDDIYEKELNFKTKHFFQFSEIKIVSSNKNLNFLNLHELKNFKIIINTNSSFAKIIEDYVEIYKENHGKMELNFVEMNNLQHIFSRLILNDNELFITTSAILFPEHLKYKLNVVKIFPSLQVRRIYKYSNI